MAAILRRQPLTIKQQVEELKNWHKQQQSKLTSNTMDNENYSEMRKDSNKNDHLINLAKFDEIPIKVTNGNFNDLVENNVAPFDPHVVGVKTEKSAEGGNKPKFSFLKKGEGIARFNMGPPKIAKKPVTRNKDLKLVTNPVKSNFSSGEENILKGQTSATSKEGAEIPNLKVPDIKLNFTWKSILSGENPEVMLEKAISSNQLELMDPNSSIDSSTASLMEKLLAIGKNKLLRDKEELKVFEMIEQHMLDSSFCSTSSYVSKLMENAVISTPNKDTTRQEQPLNSNPSEQLPTKLVHDEVEVSSQPKIESHPVCKPSYSLTFKENEEVTKINGTEQLLENNSTHNENDFEPKPPLKVSAWLTQKPSRHWKDSMTTGESVEDLEQSLHVRFADHVDCKSFDENYRSVDSSIKSKENKSEVFNDSQEWKEASEDENSCCSRCSLQDSSTEDFRTYDPREKEAYQYQQNENNEAVEQLHVGDLKTDDSLKSKTMTLNDDVNNFPPLLIAKLRELEEEIKVFREENNNVRTLRENLERERKKILEEKRQLNLEKKKLKNEFEEEQKRLNKQLEEEKQKLVKEKAIFEKYSKTLSKNPSREERKEIQALKEQLAEMKEELNKKESRWGAAQARVRNQVKVLEEDNRKLREEIETFRKQAKYWDLFNQKKKGKPFNNTKLIHAISEHISNLVLDDGSKNPANDGYSIEPSLNSKISSVIESDLKSIYGVKVTKESNIDSTLMNSKTSKSNSNNEKFPSRTPPPDVEGNCNGKNESPCETASLRTMEHLSDSPNINQGDLQNEDRCQKPCLEEESRNVIKEVVDGNGNMEIVFANGNVKKTNKFTGSEKYIYINGDVEEITHDGTVKYYYSKSRIWQTTLPDGLEIVDFPDGKIEKRHVDGTVEIIYSNNNKKFSYPDGSQEIIYSDGTKLRTQADKTHILTLPNGQKEIHTEEWKRREYPDGTMKTLYPDGTTETVYSNGRVRLKDKFGNLVMDSGSLQTL